MHGFDDAVYGLWAVFWIGWLIAAVATSSPGTLRTRHLGIRLVLAAAVFALLRFGHQWHSPTTDDRWRMGTGAAMVVGGLALAVWARVQLGRNWGTPMSKKVDPELVTDGPYRAIRHPIYTGIILAAAGTGVAVDTLWFVIAGAMAVFFTYSTFVEDATMQAAFPDAYPAYKRRTKRLIPFVF